MNRDSVRVPSMIRNYRYPMHPTAAQTATMEQWLADNCDLYNAALQERRDSWRWRKEQALCRGLVALDGAGDAKPRKTRVVTSAKPNGNPSKVTKPDKPRSIWLIAVTKAARNVGGAITTYVSQCAALTTLRAGVGTPCDVSRSALRRVDLAFDAFFRRCSNGATPGYPRFKSKRRYDSFSIGASAAHLKRLVVDRRVAIPRLGYVKFNQYRPLPTGARVLDVTVKRSCGKWWVIFCCDLGTAPTPVPVADIDPSRVVGIDVGLTTLATLSDGAVIDNPRHGRAAAKMLAQRQRCLARKQRGSKSRRRAVIQVARAHAHIANQRRDTAFKAAASLVARYDVICFEDLSIARMVHGNLARSIHDAGWGLLTHATACKAESAGKHVVRVDPNGTTIDCARCGTPVPKALSERVHRCTSAACGFTIGRDVNAAINIKTRGMRVLGLSALPPITDEVCQRSP